MIFVTVGTHEQPFDRLIEHIDSLVKNNIIVEEVIMQDILNMNLNFVNGKNGFHIQK